MSAYNVHFTAKSANDKTGPIPTTVTERKTCPPSCPLYLFGCYAGVGPVSWHWNKVTSGVRGGPWDALCAKIKALKPGQLWRHNVAGDLPGDGVKIDAPALSELVSANKGKKGFTYTHYPLDKNNLNQITRANKAGFTINLSANNLEHADTLMALQAAPVVVLLPEDTKGNHVTTPNGHKVAVCPATYKDTTCKECKLCSVTNRAVLVGFPSHGPQKKSADVIARG